MKKIIMAIMGVACLSSISANADAATGQWCFKWNTNGVFLDNNMGEDVVFSTNYPARYAYVTVHRLNPFSDTVYSIFLSDAGCTSDLSITPNATYEFRLFTRLHRGNRDIYVQSDTAGWDSTVTDGVYLTYLTGGSIPAKITVPASTNPITNQTLVMPVLSRILFYANTLGWLDGEDLKVSFTSNTANPVCNNAVDPECDDTEYRCTNNYYSGKINTYHHVCYWNGWNRKFGIAHEIGHMLGKINGIDAPNSGYGTEGIFRDPVDGAADGSGGNHCDSSEMGDAGHCLTCREFIGTAQGEGYAQFIAAATFNDQDDDEGVFVYNSNMMRPSSTHNGFLDPADIPGPTDLVFWTPPHAVALTPGDPDTNHNVRWMAFECNPISNPGPLGFTHYGTEWDWLMFWWNLWVDDDYGFSIEEINAIWSGDSERGYFCCQMDAAKKNPLDCVHKDSSADCGVGPNLAPGWNAADVKTIGTGKLFADDTDFGVEHSLVNEARQFFGDDNYNKYLRFLELSAATGVNF